MNNYSIIHGVLGSVFASDLGRSDEEASALLREMTSNSEYKRQLHDALTSALRDPGFSWMDVLNEYEVYPADDELDARNYAIQILWSSVFSQERPPAR
ncbi:hypothetical protein [Solilutibacter silvestris]|uniref:hypothetical protein n=1 Tax=Solilutibacter silvestris TaxID=1645665 RepID=UPI003D345EDA